MKSLRGNKRGGARDVTEPKVPGDVLKFSIRGDVTASRFERIHQESSETNPSGKTVIFDLRRLTNITPYAAVLLYTWISSLRERGTAVSLSLPEPTAEYFEQPRSILCGCGLLESLAVRGVSMPYKGRLQENSFIPFTQVSDRSQLQKLVGDEGLFSFLDGAEKSTPIMEALSIATAELLENAIVHTVVKQGHCFLNTTRVLGPLHDDPLGTFERGAAVLDLVVSDFGQGIERTVEGHIQGNFQPLAKKDSGKYSKAELAILWAFEWGSTRDPKGRNERISELLASGASIDISRIATGLYCVMQAVRNARGSMTVRTPSALLGFDFSSRDGQLRVLDRSVFGLSRLSYLTGTHYHIRIPRKPLVSKLQIDAAKKQRISTLPNSDVSYGFVSIAETVRDNECSEAAYIQRCLTATERALIRLRNTPSWLVIPRQPRELSTRGAGILFGSIISMPLGHCRLLFRGQSLGMQIAKDLFRQDAKDLRQFAPPNSVYFLDEARASLECLAPASTQSCPTDLLTRAKERGFDDLARSLREMLSHECRHSPGPFLIEGKYYTNVYYEIPRALAHGNDRAICTDWASAAIERFFSLKPEVIVLSSHTLLPLGQALAARLLDESGRNCPVIYPEPRTGPFAIASKLARYRTRSSVLIADVIARGQTIRDLLRASTQTKICGVLCFVDARDAAETSSTLHSPTQQAIPVVAAISEPIVRERSFNALVGTIARPDNEVLFMVDEESRVPRPVARSKTARLSVVDLKSRGALRNVNWLALGHYDHARRHYSVFLHMPTLTHELTAEMRQWCAEQIRSLFVQTDVLGPKVPWTALLLDTEKCLMPVEHALRLEFSMRSDLDQLPLPLGDGSRLPLRIMRVADVQTAIGTIARTQHASNWALLFPAISSGGTAQSILLAAAQQQALRANGRHILALYLLARQSPKEGEFFSGISSLLQSGVHHATFMSVPFGAYAANDDDCPICKRHNRVGTLADSYTRFCQDKRNLESRVLRGLQSAAHGLAPLKLAVSNAATPSFTSDRDTLKLSLLDLYERAVEDPLARRELDEELRKSLSTSSFELDVMLELVGEYRDAPPFAADVLARVIYQSADHLRKRAEQICKEGRPPYPIGRVIGGIAHLYPPLFISNVERLLFTYSSNAQDLEQIVLELMLAGLDLVEGSSLLALSRTKNTSDLEQMLAELAAFQRWSRKHGEAPALREELKTILDLKARLSRSSHFKPSVATLQKAAGGRSASEREVFEKLQKVISDWNAEISGLVSFTRKSRIWTSLDASHDFRLSAALDQLDSDVMTLIRLWKSSDQSAPVFTDENMREIVVVGDSIAKQRQYLDSALDGLLVNPAQILRVSIPKGHPLEDGRLLQIDHVERGTDDRCWILCDRHRFEHVVEEIVSNWIKYAPPDRDALARYSVTLEDDIVLLSFEDNFPGAFDTSSEGGFRLITGLTEAFGGHIRIVPLRDDGFKALQLGFLSAAKPTGDPQ